MDIEYIIIIFPADCEVRLKSIFIIKSDMQHLYTI